MSPAALMTLRLFNITLPTNIISKIKKDSMLIIMSCIWYFFPAQMHAILTLKSPFSTILFSAKDHFFPSVHWLFPLCIYSIFINCAIIVRGFHFIMMQIVKSKDCKCYVCYACVRGGNQKHLKENSQMSAVVCLTWSSLSAAYCVGKEDHWKDHCVLLIRYVIHGIYILYVFQTYLRI